MDARIENQDSVSRWAIETFGDDGTDARCAWRVLEEIVEAGRALSSDKPVHECVVEIADAAIVLLRLGHRLNEDLLGWSIGVRPLELPMTREGAMAAVTVALRDMGTVSFHLIPLVPGQRPAVGSAASVVARVWNWLRQASICLEHDLDAEIDKKMAINRTRKWSVEGGHGYHVRDRSAA